MAIELTPEQERRTSEILQEAERIFSNGEMTKDRWLEFEGKLEALELPEEVAGDLYKSLLLFANSEWFGEY